MRRAICGYVLRHVGTRDGIEVQCLTLCAGGRVRVCVCARVSLVVCVRFTFVCVCVFECACVLCTLCVCFSHL